MKIFPNFSSAIWHTGEILRTSSYEVRPGRWQSSDVSKKPEASMREILNVSFQVPIRHEDIEKHEEDIKPNLPWASEHFQERLSGPFNPGETWKKWPWALSADKYRTESGGKFSHTYGERYWPKIAGSTGVPGAPHVGIRYKYGDLNDVVNHLAADSLTRQAVLPIWFPEDTGAVHGERVPCSLFHHFILRNGFFHHVYTIRSCDFYRHLRDDIYLSLRLHLWVLEQLRHHPYRTKTYKTHEGPDPPEVKRVLKKSMEPMKKNLWWDVEPGFFTMHITSLHVFVNDFHKLFGEKK